MYEYLKPIVANIKDVEKKSAESHENGPFTLTYNERASRREINQPSDVY